MSDDPRTETVGASAVGPAAPGPEHLAGGALVGGRWRVVGPLGRGGFAVVYRARDERLGREVALKVLRGDRMTANALRRLRREATLARDLAHPSLLRVFDFEEADGLVFLTLELAPGGSLRDLLQREGRLPVGRAIEIARQVFDGLAALHAVGIVHRDVKPGNVLLGAQGEVKLSDFGLALAVEQDETRMTASEATVGTLEYLSPEQAMGEEVDARSDLYSAGLVLYEMLTGRLPHGGRSSLGTVISRFRERPPAVRAARPDAPRWLSRLVARLLERRREDRYDSAAEVAADLRRRRSALRSSQRHRLQALAALGLVAALAATVVAGERWRARQFAQPVAAGRDVVGVDRRGRVLWRKVDVNAPGYNFVPFRFAPGEKPRLAAILTRAGDPTLDPQRRLDFLDPQTGEVTDSLEMPDGSTYFPEMSRTYGFAIQAADLDRDGADELLVSYTHSPFWPCFIVLVEPRQRRARVLVVASGHHRFAESTDLDGDGRAELLFAGINNRLGWNIGVAAVRQPPDLGRWDSRGGFRPILLTDRVPRSDDRAGLVWYALAPRGLLAGPLQALTVDREQRKIVVAYAKRPAYALGFDGFPFGSASTAGAAERAAARVESQKEFSDATALLEGGEAGAAIAGFDAALAASERAGTPVFSSWIRVVRNRARIAGGLAADAERELDGLTAATDSAAEVAFDAARAFHQRGDNERALAAYRKSFLLPGWNDGRGGYEAFEGILLVLLEEQRWAEAADRVERYCRITDGAEFCLLFRQVVRWRRGETIVAADIPAIEDWPDLEAYWKLELRRAAGDSPASLRGPLARLRARTSGSTLLLDALECDLRRAAGEDAEARRIAAAALPGLDAAIAADPVLRAHAPLLRARFAAAAGRPLTRS